MNILLDTHTFLWFIDGNDKLSLNARALIEDQENAKLVSAASLWEMGLKISIGRLSLAQPFEDLTGRQMEQNGFGLLPVRIAHIARVISLPFHHRDPFDRMLAAQCMVEGLSLVSADSIFDNYSVPRVW